MRFGLASESRASKSSLTTVFLPIGGHGRLHEGCAQGEGCITGASRGQQNRKPVDADVRFAVVNRVSTVSGRVELGEELVCCCDRLGGPRLHRFGTAELL